MNSQFDRHARTYDDDLNRALSISGEDKQFFARRRIAFLSSCLRRLGEVPRSAIDYGCGTGDTARLLASRLRLGSVIGIDVSVESLNIARSLHGNVSCQFLEPRDYIPEGTIDLAYCNGVFHHVLESERGAALSYIHQSLRPGGIFAFWENNPVNPGTRYVMSRCEFDHDAVPVSSGNAKRLLAENGFQIIAVNFLFVFPRFLRVFRSLERYVSRLPFGAQYQVLCRKV